MDRRCFLKTTAICGTAAAISGLPLSELAAKEKVATPLQSKGWIKEPARKIAVVDKSDIVVVGGGPAGFAAAVSAARLGADVILLERNYFLGGLFTGCGVTPIINAFQPRRKGAKEQAVKGICEELCKKLEDAGMLCIENICRPKADPEAAKYFMEELL